MKNDKVAVVSVLLFTLFLLIFKSGPEGQGSFIKYAMGKYIDETAASVVTGVSNGGMNDDGDVMAYPGMWDNRKSTMMTTVQDIAVVSRETVLTDVYDEGIGGRGSIITYEVQEGDSLSFIAFDFGLNINTLLWANNLSNPDQLKPGMELQIPPTDGVIHKVKAGETIETIAKKYQSDVQKIFDFNGLSKSGSLQIGSVLVIPDGKISKSGSAVLAQNSSSPFSYLPNLGSFFMLPTVGFNWGVIHSRNGVDIANSCGTSIVAAADGVVTYAVNIGWNSGYGEFIKISHANNTETIYAHFSKVLVAIGQRVARGEILGLMGTTGHSTGCHLHFEVHGAKNPLAK
ncbi:MAG: metalloendopeptidase-like membrane protein [Parcubacteria group bacterium Licking1014_17]|nr:MAG: metalloendopeptidase-like membrane protein [Parcubacteria group bacterium Licking1014_17]